MIDTSKVTRVEVIDHTLPVEKGGGRCYVKWDKNLIFKVDVVLQDDGMTMKVFIKK